VAGAQYPWGINSVRSECHPVKVEAAGSSPVCPASGEVLGSMKTPGHVPEDGLLLRYGPLAQRESATLTRWMPLVQIQYDPRDYTEAMATAPCERCGQAPAGPDDKQLCSACREQVANWTEDDRLTALAQQGFEEVLGMRPPSPQRPGRPATGSAAIWARHIQQGAGMTPQQVTGWPDGGAGISEIVPDYVIKAGQVRCRHCATVLTAGPDGTWADARGSAGCFSPGVPHAPLPPGLDGSPA
jgi:hypothetical protein